MENQVSHTPTPQTPAPETPHKPRHERRTLPRHAAPQPAHIGESASDAPPVPTAPHMAEPEPVVEAEVVTKRTRTGKTTMIVERSPGHATHVTIVEENDGDECHNLRKDDEKDEDEEQEKGDDATPCPPPSEKK
jgi:hypothetical protein